MTGLLFLVPIAVAMGLGALAAFIWSLRSGQYDDLDGASARALEDDSPPQKPSRRPR
jgi:cbb3-type cytochrome oxidase maturation protein